MTRRTRDDAVLELHRVIRFLEGMPDGIPAPSITTAPFSDRVLPSAGWHGGTLELACAIIDAYPGPWVMHTLGGSFWVALDAADSPGLADVDLTVWVPTREDLHRLGAAGLAVPHRFDLDFQPTTEGLDT